VTPAIYKEIAQPYTDKVYSSVSEEEIESSMVEMEDFRLEEFAREILARNAVVAAAS